MTQPSVGDREVEMILKQKGKLVDWNLLKVPKLQDDPEEIFLITTDRNDVHF